MDRRRKRLVALILAVVGLGTIAGVGLSGGLPAQPDVSPLPAATAAPSPGAPLAEFGWFQFQETYRDQSTLTGFKLRVGTFDGVVTRSIVKSFPALTPASQLRGALPLPADRRPEPSCTASQTPSIPSCIGFQSRRAKTGYW